MTTPAPTLSVVVAGHEARATVDACLQALSAQAGDEVEVIVVDNSVDGTADVVRARYPHVRLLRAEAGLPIPVLWTRGIEASRAPVVALTTAHFRPADDWVAQIRTAMAGDAAAVGGAIENDAAGSTTDWAVYFCRYSRYMRPDEARPDLDLPGDNAAYRRAALEPCRATWAEGFWEPDVHAAMAAAGETLWRRPSILVHHLHSFDARGFIRNRLQHGTAYGEGRGRGLTAAGRLLHLARIPLVPAVLLARAVGDVRRRGRHRARLARALPLMAVFYTAWAVGEAAGMLRSLRPR